MVMDSLGILPVKKVTVEVPSFDTHKMRSSGFTGSSVRMRKLCQNSGYSKNRLSSHATLR